MEFIVLILGDAKGFRSDNQPHPGWKPRAGVQLFPGSGAGGSGTVYCQRW